MCNQDTAALEAAFLAATIETCKECRAIGYHPSRYLQMVDALGSVQAAIAVVTGPISDGFVHLRMLGRLDLSVEALVVQERFTPLFGDAVIAAARQRLASVEGWPAQS